MYDIVRFTPQGFGAYTFGMICAGLFMGNIDIDNNLYFNMMLFVISIISFFLAVYWYERDNRRNK